MTRSNRPVRSRRGRGSNVLALLIAGGGLGFLYLNFDPTLAGSDPESFAAQSAAESASIPVNVVFDEPALGTASTGSAVVTAELTSTGTVPVAPPRDDRKLNSLVRLLLAKDGIVLPEQDDRAWDDNRLVMVFSTVLLQRGLDRMHAIDSYTSTFFKQERIGGVLQDGQVVRMKVRHEPFSVYMKWIVGDKGRELLYVDGENEGNMLVHAGGWKARLVPALKLEPTGSIAMRENRHPCTMAGLKNLIAKTLEHRRRDLGQPEKARYSMKEGEEFEDRRCWVFRYEYDDRAFSPEYRKSIVFLDEEHLVPVFVENYGWPHEDEEIAATELDEMTLVERYRFTEIDLGERLADADFDRTNKSYQFRR